MNGIHEASTKSLLDYITASATSNSEDDMAYLLQLMRPTDNREEMGAVYSNLLGYNPITYFDERYLHKVYSGIIKRAPAHIREILEDREEFFIDTTLTQFDSVRNEYLLNLLAKVIADVTGWSDPEFQLSDDDFELMCLEDNSSLDSNGIDSDEDDDDDDEDEDIDEDDEDDGYLLDMGDDD